MVNSQNIAGHRERYEKLSKNKSVEDVGRQYVGGTDEFYTGYSEMETIFRHKSPEKLSIVDIGCGIGRLTRYLVEQPIEHYLGTDILPEILHQAEQKALGKDNFEFKLVDGFVIPAADKSADLVCAFSVMTHLLDEEVFDYFRETKRVLREGGIAVFSFFDFSVHRALFVEFASRHKERSDVLKFFERSTIEMFAKETGLSVIEILDGGTKMKSNSFSKVTKLLNGHPTPPEFSIGQSLAFLRA